ncbi:PAS domain S-box protein [Methanoculleus sp. FWC-SCC1]|uniref:PAS domain S-box protein n=1 Tax=Methanoculleus frigidifontis TaxID=2584085 RepID=A0ABT8MD22_9EURY|nr:PAS domain S-box protein [Methanoculleus sp. FWC-SCC1]MDN7025848.1 PAS domain S-box protein [Methanoculleus sp. FWC-SCC1]
MTRISGSSEDLRQRLAQDLQQVERSVDPGTFARLCDGIDALVRRDRSAGQERSLLGTIMESTDIHLAYLDCAFRFVRVNRAYAEGAGYAADDLIGKKHFDLFPNAENQAIFERVRETGEPFRVYGKPFVYENRPERGVTYWDWSLMPVRDAGGRVAGLVLSLTDVTGRVTAERKFRLLAGRMLEAYILYEILRDEEGTPIGYRYLELNEAAARALGRPARELIGKNLLDEYSPVNRSMLRLFYRVAATGEPEQFEMYSQILGRHLSLLIYRPQENQLALIGSDITERKEMEEHLASHASLFNRLNDAIVATDERQVVTAWNRAAAALYGVGADEAIGRPVADVIGSDLCGASCGESGHREAVHHHAGGMPIFVEESCMPIYAYGGTFAGYVSVIRDITDRKMAESALKESEQRFRQIFDESPIGICYYTPEGRLVAANTACLRVFGAPSREALERLDLLKSPLFPTGVRERIRRGEQIRATVTLDPDQVQRLCGAAAMRSGTVAVDLFGGPVIDPKTEAFRGYLIQMMDVTGRIVTETIKRDAYRQIERNMEQFAVLGDHIRHPLQVVMARADLLEDEATAASIRDQVRRVNDIVRQLDQGWIESRAIREFLRKNEMT